jgi:protein phosphatase
VLCSDGLSGFVSAETIEETMATIADVDACADRLVQLALRAGGGDNITVVLADVVELDDVADGEGPTTNATVVGAAALTRNDPTSAADGPAARAAGLARAAQVDDDAPEAVTAQSVTEDDDEQPAGPRRWRSVVLWLGIAALVVGAAAIAYSWTPTQYYVGVDEDEVVIFRGLPQTLGPIALSSVVERTGTSLDDLNGYMQGRVEQTIHADSLDDARDLVAMLDEDTSPRPTPTATPTSVPTGTATP